MSRQRGLRRRAVGCLGLVLLVAGLVIAYGVYQYGARERAAVPATGDLPARLLDDLSYAAAVWLAHPHQNLAVLEQALGGRAATGRWLAAMARLAGVDDGREIRLPAFGPFAVPPAREMAVAWRRGSDAPSAVLAARIDPVLALVGRLAGRVAGNPWLRGGRVQVFGGPAEVRWQEGLWVIGPPGAPLDPAAAAERRRPLERPPALALLRLGSTTRREMPAGRYRLARPPGMPEDLELALEADESERSDPFEAVLAHLDVAGPAAAWVQGAGEERTGMVLILRSRGRRGLPPAAVLAPAGDTAPAGRRLRLPHERLPSFLRDDWPSGEVGPWRVLATDDEALRTARALAAELPAPRELPRRALWVDVAAMRDFVDSVLGVMEEVPLFPREDLRRWRDLRTVLAPMERFARITLLSRAGSPPSAPDGATLPKGASGAPSQKPLWRLRLHRHLEGPPDSPDSSRD